MNRSARIANWIALAALVLSVFALLGGKEWIESQGWTLNPDAEKSAETIGQNGAPDESENPTVAETAEPSTGEDDTTGSDDNEHPRTLRLPSGLGGVSGRIEGERDTFSDTRPGGPGCS